MIRFVQIPFRIRRSLLCANVECAVGVNMQIAAAASPRTQLQISVSSPIFRFFFSLGAARHSQSFTFPHAQRRANRCRLLCSDNFMLHVHEIVRSLLRGAICCSSLHNIGFCLSLKHFIILS